MSELLPPPPPPTTVPCPQCATQVPCYDPAGSRYFGCATCRTYFQAVPGQAGTTHRVDGFRQALAPGPRLPLGATAMLGGYPCRVTGYQVRTEEADKSAKWAEYQLRPAEPLPGAEPADHPLQLAEYHGHWLLIRRTAAHPTTTGTKAFRERTWRDATADHTYRLWHRYQPVVSEAQGEFDWNILEDEQLLITEFISPPYMLVSEHRAQQPPTWYRAEYLEPAQVAAAFGLDPDHLPDHYDVGAAQPNPVAAGHLVRLAATLVLLLLGLQWLLARPEVHMGQQFNLPDTPAAQAPLPTVPEGPVPVPYDSLPAAGAPATAAAPAPAATTTPPPAYSQMLVSDPIVVTAPAVLTVDLHIPGLTNHWVEVTASLVNEQTGRGYEFTRSLEYYEGVEGGESWSEGSRSASAVLSQVPPGRYHLNLYPSAEPGTAGTTLTVAVEQSTAPYSNFWLVLLVLLSVPLLQWWRYSSFETERWENSNFGPDSST